MNNEPQNNSGEIPLTQEARIELQRKVVEDLKKLFPADEQKKITALFEPIQEKVKPPNWSKHSNAPYYRERYALQMKQVLDSMIAQYDSQQFEEKMFYYSDTPELSRNSLYLKINQSKLYLLDHLDPDNRYRNFDYLIRIKTIKDKGVKICYKDGVLAADDEGRSIRNAVNVINPIQQKTISEEIELFLQRAKPHDKFHKTKLFLTDHEVQVIQASLGGLDDIAAIVKHNEIKIVKLPPDQKML